MSEVISALAAVVSCSVHTKMSDLGTLDFVLAAAIAAATIDITVRSE